MMWEGKLLSGVKSMYVDSSASARVNGVENERFGINILVIQGCVMSPFNVYTVA